MIIHDLPQGTPEWFAVRRGKPTASEFKQILTATGKPSTSAHRYMCTLLAEWLAGDKLEAYENEWMRRGNELEPQAREMYEFVHDAEVVLVGFCEADDRSAGCSPDGLVGDDGLVEIKCPAPWTHVSYLLAGKCPADYVPQVQGQLMITERQWCDFISYHPDLPPLVVRVQRDEAFIAALREALANFNTKLEVAKARLTKEAA